jgi:hypothetical protein
MVQRVERFVSHRLRTFTTRGPLTGFAMASHSTTSPSLNALEAAEKKLQQALPPVDPKAIAAAKTREQEAIFAVNRARVVLDKAITERMPWFDELYKVLYGAGAFY